MGCEGVRSGSFSFFLMTFKYSFVHCSLGTFFKLQLALSSSVQASLTSALNLGVNTKEWTVRPEPVQLGVNSYDFNFFMQSDE